MHDIARHFMTALWRRSAAHMPSARFHAYAKGKPMQRGSRNAELTPGIAKQPGLRAYERAKRQL